MSYSYSNLQFKTSESASVRLAIDLCDIGSAKMLARADSAWVSVYPFLTEDDFGFLKQVAERMCGNISVPTFGFLVPNPAVFKYALFEDARLVDQYSTDAPSTSEERLDLLMPHCIKGTTKRSLKELFQIAPHERAGDRMAQQFAELLGIPRTQMLMGYNYLKWAQAGR